MKSSYKADIISTIAITIFGIVQGQVTVFYIIYLFWFQELIRTAIDMIFLRKFQKQKEPLLPVEINYTGSLFLLFIYLVFIVILFCFMLNWGNYPLLSINLRVLLFKNIFFNCNLLFFALSFLYFRVKGENLDIRISTFNPRHIILHLSIILGGCIQFFIIKKYNIESVWGSVAVISPFLLLKVFFEIKFQDDRNSQKTREI